MVIPNDNSFQVPFDIIASGYFTWKIYVYFSVGNGHLRVPALCQLYRHTFVPYTSTKCSMVRPIIGICLWPHIHSASWKQFLTFCMLATRHYSTDTFYGRILIQNELLEHVDTFPHPAYRRWWVYDGIRYQVKQTAGDQGITAENMEVTAYTHFNEDTTNESASVACSNARLWEVGSQDEWRNALTPLRWKNWERFCGFRAPQRKQMSGFLTKLE